VNKQKKIRKLTLSKETLCTLVEDRLLQEIAGGATLGTCGTEDTQGATNCACAETGGTQCTGRPCFD
jgi:hypothetical protein